MECEGRVGGWELGARLDESVSQTKWTVLARLSLTNLAPFTHHRADTTAGCGGQVSAQDHQRM